MAAPLPAPATAADGPATPGLGASPGDAAGVLAALTRRRRSLFPARVLFALGAAGEAAAAREERPPYCCLALLTRATLELGAGLGRLLTLSPRPTWKRENNYWRDVISLKFFFLVVGSKFLSINFFTTYCKRLLLLQLLRGVFFQNFFGHFVGLLLHDLIEDLGLLFAEDSQLGLVSADLSVVKPSQETLDEKKAKNKRGKE